jgi:hypothetical protein
MKDPTPTFVRAAERCVWRPVRAVLGLTVRPVHWVAKRLNRKAKR